MEKIIGKPKTALSGGFFCRKNHFTTEQNSTTMKVLRLHQHHPKDQNHVSN